MACGTKVEHILFFLELEYYQWMLKTCWLKFKFLHMATRPCMVSTLLWHVSLNQMVWPTLVKWVFSYSPKRPSPFFRVFSHGTAYVWKVSLYFFCRNLILSISVSAHRGHPSIPGLQCLLDETSSYWPCTDSVTYHTVSSLVMFCGVFSIDGEGSTCVVHFVLSDYQNRS